MAGPQTPNCGPVLKCIRRFDPHACACLRTALSAGSRRHPMWIPDQKPRLGGKARYALPNSGPTDAESPGAGGVARRHSRLGRRRVLKCCGSLILCKDLLRFSSCRAAPVAAYAKLERFGRPSKNVCTRRAPCSTVPDLLKETATDAYERSRSRRIGRASVDAIGTAGIPVDPTRRRSLGGRPFSATQPLALPSDAWVSAVDLDG